MEEKTYLMQSSWVIADGHVHIHPCFSPHVLLRQAHDNLLQNATRLGLDGHIPKVLFLTESGEENWFETLCLRGLPGVSVIPTKSINCVKIGFSDTSVIIVIAGRQIVTSEHIEVLAFGLDSLFPDGLPIHVVVEKIAELGHMAVLPWGAGKWLAKRGKRVRDVFKQYVHLPLYLGDNGNRPKFWPLPGIFKQARQLGILNLPGSDPLPFIGQEKRVGNYGFAIEGMWNDADPYPSIKKMMKRKFATIQHFGTPPDIRIFLFHQTAMQFKKQRKK